MARNHRIAIDGHSFLARRGQLLLDAALSNGIDLPHDCRAGHCGTCCVRLVSGEVRGGEGSEPGIVHACQCRIVGDAVIERGQPVHYGAGSQAVADALSTYQPIVGLHGHIHESRGATRYGRTPAFNPGSEYGEGVLRGLIVAIRGGEMLGHQFTSG